MSTLTSYKKKEKKIKTKAFGMSGNTYEGRIQIGRIQKSKIQKEKAGYKTKQL